MVRRYSAMAESAQQLQHLVDTFKKGISEHESDSRRYRNVPEIRKAFRDDLESVKERLAEMPLCDEERDVLLDSQTESFLDLYRGNAENLIGTVKVPLGVAGPILAKGLFARDYFFLPLATHEAALVASYHRGAMAINAAGGCTTAVLNEGVSRCPGFCFENLAEVGKFSVWAIENQERFKMIAEKTTSHGKLVDLRLTVEASNVYLNFEYNTGDAAGQNMVTMATEAVCEYIEENTPVKPRHWFVESNMSGDKKASLLSFVSVRGKKVSAEIRIPAEVLQKRLKTTAKAMEDYWRMSSMGGVLSGTIGVQGHYANGLAALYIACGQDAACVSESSVGTTRFEAREDGSLYAAVTLPNLIVGTVGGGTSLPSQNACLKLMNLAGENHANAFAEVCSAMCLAGELSIISALTEGDFSRAHRVLARRRAKTEKA